MASAPNLPVLVVGAGPTGLQMALELTCRGVVCRIVDKESVRSDRSRALVVQARTLEVLQKHGLAEDLVERGRRSITLTTYVNRRLAFRAELGDVGVEDTPYPFVLFVSQAETERVLERELERHGCRVERPVELAGFRQEDQGIAATLLHPGGREEMVRSSFLVGCDGAHSQVRRSAGLSFEGDEYEEDFVMADAEIAWREERARDLEYFVSRDGRLTLYPFRESSLYRIVVSRPRETKDDPGPLNLEDFQRLLDHFSPFSGRLHDPRWLARFRLHRRCTNRYRAGRAFVAGDAAHVHSPAGGQGMNTGIQDAANLGWKMVLVLSGRACEGLLDSYEAERLPVGRRLLRTTDRLFSLAAARTRPMAALRNGMLSLAPRLLLTSRRLREWIFRFVSQLSIRYPASPIVAENLSHADRSFRLGAAAGSRAPDAPLRAGHAGPATSLFAEMSGTAHHLLLFSGSDTKPARVAARELEREFPGLWKTHVIARSPPDDRERFLFDTEGLAFLRYGVGAEALYLVRPDGYIAYRSGRIRPRGLAEHLERIGIAGAGRQGLS